MTDGNPSQSKTLQSLSRFAAVLAIFGFVLVAVGVLLAQIRFAPMYVEMGVKLPAVTRQILDLPLWGVLAGLLAWVAGLVVALLSSCPRWVALLLSVLSLFAALVMLATIAIFLYLPIRGLIEGLS